MKPLALPTLLLATLAAQAIPIQAPPGANRQAPLDQTMPVSDAWATRPPERTVLRCKLAQHHKMDLVATPMDLYTVTLSTKLRGKTEPAFSRELSRPTTAGALALRLCLDGVLVYALQRQDGTPGVRGVVLRHNPRTRKLQRLEFSHAALPYGLYVNPDEMRLVVPTKGPGSTSHYMIYSSRTGQGQPSNMLPSGNRFTFYALQ